MAELLDNCLFTAGSMGTADFADGAADPTCRNLEDAGAEDGAVYPYKARNATGTEWEIGRGTVVVSGGTWTLERTTIQDSSDGGAKINFGTHPKIIITAGKVEIGDVKGPESATDGAIAVFDGASGKLLKDGGQPIASLLPRDGSAAMTGPLVLTEDDAPGTPDAGQVALYAKSDGKLYRKDDTGAEEEVGAGVGGVGPVFDTLAEAAAFSPTIAPPWINTRGHASAGDGGGAEYKHVGSSAPAHAGAFAITLADGVTSIWYELSTSPVSPFMLGAKGDGVTNDSVAFDALRVLLPRGEVDLEGKTFMVDAIPAGAYRNGYFKVPNYEGQLSALIPAKDTIETALTCLAAGPYYAAWPQDKWHVWEGVIYAFWMESTQHSTSDAHKYIVCMRSKDGGKTWTHKERLFKGLTVNGSSSFAAGVTDGVQWIEVRDDATNEHRLFCRRLPQRYELTGCVNTTSGSNQISIPFASAGVVIGAYEGMSADLNNVGTVGGLAISGTYPVSFINSQRIQFTHGSNATSTVVNAGGTGTDGYFNLIFNETAWTQVDIDGGNLGTAIVNAWGSGTEVNLHSFAAVSSSATVGDYGTFFLGVSGGEVNVGVAKVTRPFDANKGQGGTSIGWVEQISGDLALAEPTLTYVGTPAGGKLYGFCRTQTSDVGPIFWWADYDGVTLGDITTTSAAGGYATQSPIPLVVVGDTIYGFASGSRTGEGSPQGNEKAVVPLYLLRASVADAEVDGFAAFDWIVIDEAHFENHYFAVSNAVGVGSIIALDEATLMVGYSTEVAADNPSLGPTRVYALKIDIGNLFKRGKSRVEPGQVASLNDAYWFWRGCSAIANGSYMRYGNEVIETAPRAWDSSTGYFTPPETGLYEFHGEVRYAAGTIGEKSLQLVDSSDANVLGGLLLGVAYASATTAEAFGQYNVPVFLRQGQRVRLKVNAPNGTANSTIRSYLYIKKAT